MPESSTYLSRFNLFTISPVKKTFLLILHQFQSTLVVSLKHFSFNPQHVLACHSSPLNCITHPPSPPPSLTSAVRIIARNLLTNSCRVHFSAQLFGINHLIQLTFPLATCDFYNNSSLLPLLLLPLLRHNRQTDSQSDTYIPKPQFALTHVTAGAVAVAAAA